MSAFTFSDIIRLKRKSGSGHAVLNAFEIITMNILTPLFFKQV